MVLGNELRVRNSRVHVTRVLHTARIGNAYSVMFVNRMRERLVLSYELRNRPRSPWSLCGTVVEHPSAVLEGLRFDSSWGLRIFSLSQARDKTKNIFMISIDGKRSSEN